MNKMKKMKMMKMMKYIDKMKNGKIENGGGGGTVRSWVGWGGLAEPAPDFLEIRTRQ